MSPTKTFPAPAKLNLFLHITGKRPDGYHNLQTLFQFIDFCDSLSFQNYQEIGTINLQADIEGLAPENNLIIRAANLLRQTTGTSLGADISLTKRLPMGGGLGGGSSDAATTLVALNHLWGTGLSLYELERLGLMLGADVPVFIRGKAALAEGVGEKLNPVKIPTPWYLLITPKCHIETAALFADKQLTRNSKPIKIRAFLEGASHNDFEPVARRQFPLVDKAFGLLGSIGNPKLTGTGACIFCSYTGSEEAELALSRLPTLMSQSGLKPDELSARVVKGLNQSPLFSREIQN